LAGQGRRAPRSPRGATIIEGRSRFFQFVFERLFTRPDDVVIVARALDVIDGIYPVIGDHLLYSVVHAEHFDLRQAEDGVLLWNNHYENVFTRPELIDGLIVSTGRQKDTLDRQLASLAGGSDAGGEYGTGSLGADSLVTGSPGAASSGVGAIPVVCIPVGYATDADQRAQPAPASYDRTAIVTASRLAEEKHIDILIRAVALAQARVPDIRLDVYGEGNRDRLLAVIKDTGTADRVRLMGHHTLDGVLGSYALYVSASTSEGFGLSLVEALAVGLPIVGFDVDYGNREMIAPNVNGILVPHTSYDADVRALAAAIGDVLTSGALDDMRRASLRKAEAFTAAHVRALWAQLLRGAEAAC
jgi:glycosyltransferase involved in cell wall biosynthesis